MYDLVIFFAYLYYIEDVILVFLSLYTLMKLHYIYIDEAWTS